MTQKHDSKMALDYKAALEGLNDLIKNGDGSAWNYILKNHNAIRTSLKIAAKMEMEPSFEMCMAGVDKMNERYSMDHIFKAMVAQMMKEVG